MDIKIDDQLKKAFEEYLGQQVLGANILNYKAANTSFIDALNVSKAIGPEVFEVVKKSIAPFPQHHVSLISTPDSGIKKLLITGALAAGLLGGGAMLPSALESLKTPTKPIPIPITNPIDNHIDSDEIEVF